MAKLRSKLTYANVMATIAVFGVLGGGSAFALSGHNTVFSDDIAPKQVEQGDLKPAMRWHELDFASLGHGPVPPGVAVSDCSWLNYNNGNGPTSRSGSTVTPTASCI